MVAVIHQSRSLRNALNYNEQKVKEKKAECLLAMNYPKDVDELNFHQKLMRLTNLAALNPRTLVNSVHLSLNFDPSEKLSRETLRQIAQQYMALIGFGEQPYLVYQHHDSGHPHLHVVTTNIQPDGKRISLHNLGRHQSEKARKSLEQTFGLVIAGDKETKKLHPVFPVQTGKIIYGKSATKRAISQVVTQVMQQYHFASLPEFNAVLRLYNLEAQRGAPDSRTYKRGGLVYRVLDEQGQPIGVPIKASSLFGKPTLVNLEKQYLEGAKNRKLHEQRLRTAIDWALTGRQRHSFDKLAEALRKENIAVLFSRNKEGQVFGVTYVDHRTKSVFKGSDLGKPYAANGLQQRLESGIEKTPHRGEEKSNIPENTGAFFPPLIMTQEASDQPPAELRNTKKKKKRKYAYRRE